MLRQVCASGRGDAMVALMRRPVPLLVALIAAAPAPSLPPPGRPVSPIVSASWSDEISREHAGEADAVIRLAGVRRGMRIGDVGAGEGYYTLKLSKAVGKRGEVVAEDIVPGVVARLKGRVGEAGLANVRVVLGSPDDPQLGTAGLDRAFLIHMYHEIAQPYALMWRVHDALKPGGMVAVVDSYRPTGSHGTPPKLLRCELAAVGFRQAGFKDLGDAGGYLALFVPVKRPDPATVKACYRG